MALFVQMLIFATTGLAHAEYRAFELVITNSATGQERVLVSNLDPRQYRRYYPIKITETVLYRDTWMCRGNTSHFQAICPKPEGADTPSAKP